jgi:hypothetical protein
MAEKAASSKPQTMTGQALLNRVMLGMLSTPLVSRGIGRRLVTLYVVGRKTGRRFTIPVAYTRQGEDLLVGTPFGWGRNLRTGEPLEIRLKGKRRLADVEAFSDEPGVTRLYTIICRDNKAFAGLNKVGMGPDGEPRPQDLHAAWANGARAFRIRPRPATASS